MKLIRIGYWKSMSAPDWPTPEAFVDQSWQKEAREELASYLSRGMVARAYLGRSTCRICGESVGSLELSDGVYIWPEGLAHYVSNHAVRLPIQFEDHVQASAAQLEEASIDDSWWRSHQ